jgi:hypothetical protein
LKHGKGAPKGEETVLGGRKGPFLTAGRQR